MKLHALPSVTLDGVHVTLSTIGDRASTLVTATMTREEAHLFLAEFTNALAATEETTRTRTMCRRCWQDCSTCVCAASRKEGRS